MEPKKEEKTIRAVVNSMVEISHHIDKVIELLKTIKEWVRKEATDLTLLDGDDYRLTKK